MNKNTFVKLGYDYRDLVFNDGIAKNAEGEVVGIKINERIEHPIQIPKSFAMEEVRIYDKKDKTLLKEVQTQYRKQLKRMQNYELNFTKMDLFVME